MKYKIKCKHCGRMFFPNNSNTMFCGRKCFFDYRSKNKILDYKKIGRKQSITKKKMYSEGKLVIWNKKLNKENSKLIRKTCKKISLIKKKGYKSGELKIWNKNKKRTILERRKMRLTRIELLKNKKVKYPNYNKKACDFFKLLNKKYDLKGRHAEYKGEFYIKELGYWLDYYIPELNLVIEWNEKKHYEMNEHTGRYNLTNKHKFRQNEIKKHLDCTWININQESFDQQRCFKRVEKYLRVNYLKLAC